MNCEHNAVCEKIINEIDAVFHKDPDLCGFEIIHLTSNQNTNKSPVVHVENNLGLESWCIQHVYEYAHKTILANKLENTKSVQNVSNIKYLNCAILINPDVSTFWNVRRQLFVKNKLNISKEFQFTAIVLSKKPKSNAAFFYRRWLFSFQSGESIDWTIELGLCERCADKNASNYYAWCHRQWVLQKAPYLLKFEARITEKFIRKHIGDYSGYHHRQYVLCKLLETGFLEHESNDYSALIDFVSVLMSIEIKSVNDLIKIILPNFETIDVDEDKIKSFLYCLNIAAYDVQFCEELKQMFGYREAFECHRKAVLKFIVDNCLLFNSTAELYQPLTKMLKVDGTKSPFLEALKSAEEKLGDLHKKWCRIFLGFDYSDNSVDEAS